MLAYLNDKPELKADFDEALRCYANAAYNAFAAMCRRCIQTIAKDKGVKGTNKVQDQVKEVKELLDLDDTTFSELSAVMLGGHDGAHPHLPTVKEDRAGILLEMLKEVVHHLYVRKARAAEALRLRKEQIAAAGSSDTDDNQRKKVWVPGGTPGNVNS
jgi:hypothetical protein